MGSSFLLSLLIKSSMASFLIFLNKIVEENTTIACKNNRLPNIRNNITTKSTFFMLLWNACEWWRRFFGMQKIVNKERIAFYSEKCMRKNLIKSWLWRQNTHKCVCYFISVCASVHQLQIYFPILIAATNCFTSISSVFWGFNIRYNIRFLY